jgi:hypothetical protein
MRDKMQKQDINKHKWKVSDKLKIMGWVFDYGIQTISTKEQEFGVLKSRDLDFYYVDCSDQTYITKLSKNPSFMLEVVYINEKTDFIVYITGKIHKRGVTLRNSPVPTLK